MKQSNFSEKLNEIRDEIKQQNIDINKSLEEVDEHFRAIVKQLQDEVNESRKRKEGVDNGTCNKVSGCNGVNCNYESIVGVYNRCV